ncbi:HNH endonuclease [Gordonia spumicola]|nr:HNH endonuclease [Gordonia spumicola]
MTGWIVRIDPALEVHAGMTYEDELWDIRNYGVFKEIQPGDEVFFWVNGSNDKTGFRGYGRITTPLEELTPESRAKANWLNRDEGGYTHRFRFTGLSPEPTSSPTRFGELKAMLATALFDRATGHRITDEDDLEKLRSMYDDAPFKGWDFEYPTSDDETAQDPHTDYTHTPGVDSREQTLSAITVRRGGRKFRRSLITAYEGRCAIPDFDAEGALEGAHIDPYNGDETDHVQNGLLLRADIHTLFDLHQLAIDDDYRVILSEELRGSMYSDLHGASISLPANNAKRPSLAALERHRTRCRWLTAAHYS